MLGIIFGGALAAIAAAIIAGRLSRAVKISEFRQQWINDLRKDIADYVGASHRWLKKYQEMQRIDYAPQKQQFEFEKLIPIQNEAKVILCRIRMRINPRDDNPTKMDDDRLLSSLDDLLNLGKIDQDHAEDSWFKLADNAVEQAREILKREWEVAKQPRKWI